MGRTKGSKNKPKDSANNPSADMLAALTAQGFSVARTGSCFNVSGDLPAYINYIDAVKSGRLAFTIPANKDHATSRLTDRGEFYGAPYGMLRENLDGKMDMTLYDAAYEKLRVNDLSEKLQSALLLVNPRRKRIMSEHDGDWDLDRKWDIRPFQSTHKVLAHGRAIELVVHSAINCNSKSKDIEKYGALVWSVCNLIESCGITVGITLSYALREITKDNSIGMTASLRIKKCGEYIEPTRLAASLQSAFLRKGIFSFIAAIADTAGKTVAINSGRPTQVYCPIKNVSDGTLEIAPCVSSAYDSEIIAEILRTITGTQASAA